MVNVRGGVVFVAVATLCIAVLAVGPASALNAQEGEDLEEIGEDAEGVGIDTDAKCLSGDGKSFTVGSDDGAHIWIRLHLAGLTDSGGSFGGELTGSTEDERIIEIVAGLEHAGDGFLDTITSPTSAFQTVGAFDFQLPIFEEVTPDVAGADAPGSGDENGGESRNESGGASDGSFELIDC